MSSSSAASSSSRRRHAAGAIRGRQYDDGEPIMLTTTPQMLLRRRESHKDRRTQQPGRPVRQHRGEAQRAFAASRDRGGDDHAWSRALTACDDDLDLGSHARMFLLARLSAPLLTSIKRVQNRSGPCQEEQEGLCLCDNSDHDNHNDNCILEGEARREDGGCSHPAPASANASPCETFDDHSPCMSAPSDGADARLDVVPCPLSSSPPLSPSSAQVVRIQEMSTRFASSIPPQEEQPHLHHQFQHQGPEGIAAPARTYDGSGDLPPRLSPRPPQPATSLPVAAARSSIVVELRHKSADSPHGHVHGASPVLVPTTTTRPAAVAATAAKRMAGIDATFKDLLVMRLQRRRREREVQFLETILQGGETPAASGSSSPFPSAAAAEMLTVVPHHNHQGGAGGVEVAPQPPVALFGRHTNAQVLQAVETLLQVPGMSPALLSRFVRSAASVGSAVFVSPPPL